MGPMMHIDVHGKADCLKEQFHVVEIGIKFWDIWIGCNSTDENLKLAQDFRKNLVTNLSQVLEKYSKKGKQFKCTSNGKLNGFWGNDRQHSLSHQSIKLNIPSLQLEIP